MSSRVKRVFWLLATTLIMAGLIYFTGVERFLQALKTARLTYILYALVLGLSFYGILSYVWYSFFRQLSIEGSFHQVFRLFMSGQFLNFITPVGQFGGEPLMAYIISDNTDSSYEKALSTVISADIINAIPALTFLLGSFIYLFLIGDFTSFLWKMLFVSVILGSAVSAVIYLLWFDAGRIESFILGLIEKLVEAVGKGESILESAEERLSRVEDAFQEVGESRRHLVEVLLIAHLGFTMQAGVLYFVLLSLGVESNLLVLFPILVFSVIGTYSPTPGGSGTTEAVMATFISMFVSVDLSLAVVASILFRLTTYWPGLILGYICLNSIGKDYSDFK